MSQGVTVFICGGSKPTCYRCSRTATAQCATCQRPLCDEHRRRVDGQDCCSQHAPMETSKDMPVPPPLRRPS